MSSHNSLDLRRQKFGRLRVLEPTDGRAANGAVIWRCRCLRHRQRVYVLVATHNLTSGNTVSCGCWQQEVSRRPTSARATFAATGP